MYPWNAATLHALCFVDPGPREGRRYNVPIDGLQGIEPTEKRKQIMQGKSIILLLSLLAGTATTSQAAPSRYRVTPITISAPYYLLQDGGLNNEGAVTLTAYDASFTTTHIYLWRNGKARDLGTPQGEGSYTFSVRGISDRNEIVGSTLSANNPPHGFIWSRGQFEDIGHPPGANYALTLSRIDLHTQIIGFAAVDSGTVNPILWEEGHFIVLPELPGGQTNNGPGGTSLNDINNRGVIVGRSGSDPDDRPKPVMWRNGVISRLPLPPNADSAEADAVNSLAHIVGYANQYTDFPQTDPEEPLFWHDGVVTVLPIPAGSHQAYATAINDSDQIVGFAIADSASYPVLWQKGVAYNLNTLIQSDGLNQPSVSLISAYAINNRGQIVGDAFDPGTGAIASYLLTPQN